jgi:arylsulfatase
LVAATTLTSHALAQAQKAPPAAPAPAALSGRRPNILVIFGDDIGQTNISAYSFGLMGYKTPNIDRIAREGMMFTDYYAEQSCTAGRSSFITGQCTLRTGLSKVGIPGATVGLQARDATIAELLKPLGYATFQFGKNHLGDRNEFLPTVHGFDEFFGNLYHLNAEEDPESRTYPRDPAFRQALGPRGVLRCKATDRDDPTDSRAGARSAGRRSRTPARSPGSEWRRSTTKRRLPPSISCNGRSGRTRRSSAGSTPPACICARMCGRRIVTDLALPQEPSTTTV